MFELSDENVFHHIVAWHLLPEGRCTACGFLRGLYRVRGQYFRLCPRCVQLRINVADLQLGGLPPDIGVLRQEAIQERMQWRRKVESVLVDRSHVWTCHRCGDRMTRFEARLIPSQEESEAEDHHKVCYACFLLTHPGNSSGAMSQTIGTSFFELSRAWPSSCCT